MSVLNAPAKKVSIFLHKENTMRCRTKLGFTLVELLVVVLILGALAFVAIPRIGQSSTTAKNNACDTNVDLLNSQIEL